MSIVSTVANGQVTTVMGTVSNDANDTKTRNIYESNKCFSTTAVPLQIATRATSVAQQQQQQQQQQLGVVQEPLLSINPNRFVLSPEEKTKYHQIWNFYKKAQASFWTAEEIDLSGDRKDWAALTSNEQHFLKYVLAFFASSDGIVLEI